MQSLRVDLSNFQRLLKENPQGDETRKLLSKVKIGLIDVNVLPASQVKDGNEEALLYRMSLT